MMWFLFMMMMYIVGGFALVLCLGAMLLLPVYIYEMCLELYTWARAWGRND